MAQFRPRRRERRDEPTATTTAAAGRQVSVAAGTAADLARADAGLVGERTPTDHLGTIGYDAACKAAQDAGRRPPSRRTFRRWKQQGRIPDDRTADLVARRAEITRMGGVDGAAQQLGRSPSAVYDWRAGRTKSLRPDAQGRLVDAQVAQRLVDSGVDVSRMRPTIHFTADVHARTDGGNYDYRMAKSFDFGGPQGLDHTQMSRQQIAALGDALARDDHARVAAILEEHASVNFAAFDDFDDDTGFHFDGVREFRIDWN